MPLIVRSRLADYNYSMLETNLHLEPCSGVKVLHTKNRTGRFSQFSEESSPEKKAVPTHLDRVEHRQSRQRSAVMGGR